MIKKFTSPLILLVIVLVWMHSWRGDVLPLSPREENIPELSYIWNLYHAAHQQFIFSTWNPLTIAGTVNLIQRGYLLFAPLAYLAYLLKISPDLIYKLSVAVTFYFSSITMYYFLRHLKLSLWPALLGGFLYMSSPPHLAIGIEGFDFNVFWAIIPLLILQLEKFIGSPQSNTSAIFTGLLLSAALFSGTTYFVATIPIFTAYSFMRLRLTNTPHQLKFFYLSLLVFLGTSALVTLPSLLESPYAWISQETTRRQVINLPNLNQLFNPFLLRFRGHNVLSFEFGGNFTDMSWYLGTISLLLSLIGILSISWRRYTFPLLILSIALLPFYVSLHSPFVKSLALQLLSILPQLQIVYDHTFRLFLPVVFSLSTLAAIGLQQLLRFRYSNLIGLIIFSLALIDLYPFSAFFRSIPLSPIRQEENIYRLINQDSQPGRYWSPFPFIRHLPHYRWEYLTRFVTRPRINNEFLYTPYAPRFTTELFDVLLAGALETQVFSPEFVGQLLTWSQTRYIIFRPQIFDYQAITDFLIQHGWQILHQSPDSLILKNPQPTPPIQLYNRFIPIEADKVYQPNFWVKQAEQGIATFFGSASLTSQQISTSPQLVHWSRPSPSQIFTRVETSSPTLVVSSEGWYPGWQVTIDNQPAPLLRANYAFLGVIVPAGNHLVLFAYSSPWYFKIGLLISLLSLVSIFLFWLRPYLPQSLIHHRRFLSLLLSLILILLIFVSAEIWARHQISLEEKSRTPVYVADSLLGYRLKPNLRFVHKALGKNTPQVKVETTAQGFRDIRLYAIPKPANTFRILMLGDSFIQGDEVPLEQTVSKVLEHSLHSLSSSFNFEVINTAWRGSNPLQQYLWFKSEGIKLQPDLVILNFYVGNDVDDVFLFNVSTDQAGLTTKLELKDTFIDNQGFLRHQPSPRRIRGIPGFINVHICDPLFLCKYYLRPTTDRFLVRFGLGKHYYRWSKSWFSFIWKDLTPETDQAWQLTQTHILAIKATAEKTGSRFLLVSIPFDHQVDKTKWPQKALQEVSLAELEDMHQGNYPQERIKNFVHTHPLPWLDLLPTFRASPEKTYFDFDFHWSPAGHHLAAKLILEALITNHLLP